ncbi:MAG: DUF4282 domain-containing protein [Maricaulaceae bacterium]
MTNLINFFFSFDKLMKEGLVRAFYWLALIMIGLKSLATIFYKINFTPLEGLVNFVMFFGMLLLSIVATRLIAELAIALFRINDNLSPDGGKAETADIDPLAEARRAAEMAAKRASDVTKSAVDKTMNKDAEAKAEVPKTKTTAKATGTKTTPVKKAASKTAAAPKKATAKKPAPKKTTTKSASTKKAPAPRKKAAPKSKPKT